MGASRSRHRERAGSQMAHEQTPEMARAYAEPLREIVDAGSVETAVADQPKRPRDGRGGAAPGRRTRRRLRSAAATRPESRLLRCGGASVEMGVLAFRQPGRTARTAVDAGRLHSDHETPLEAAVATGQRPVAACVVQVHSEVIRTKRAQYWLFSDLASLLPNHADARQPQRHGDTETRGTAGSDRS